MPKVRLLKSGPQGQDSDYDGAWKEALRLHFREFVFKYFPRIAALIDWSKPMKWFDKEISQVIGRAKSKSRAVDLLVQVRLLNGQSRRLLIHMEFQSSSEKNFAERLSHY